MAPRIAAKVALALALPLALWTTAVAAADSVDVRHRRLFWGGEPLVASGKEVEQVWEAAWS